MQPAFLPWLGYFDRLFRSDLHIVLDHVESDRNSKTKFLNRNRIRTRQNWTWLTVPILTKGKQGELEIDRLKMAPDQRWAVKMWRSIEASYGKAPYFPEFAPRLSEILFASDPHIFTFDRRLTDFLTRALDFSVPTVSSREMDNREKKGDLILSLCRACAATSYISGPFGRDYLDPAAFRDAKIELLFHDYRHPEYKQAFPGFEPYMSTIDLLFNHGPASRAILTSGQELARE